MGATRHRICSLGLGGTMPPATAAPLPARGRGRGLRALQPPSPRGDGTRLPFGRDARMSASGVSASPVRDGVSASPPFSARGKGPRARARALEGGSTQGRPQGPPWSDGRVPEFQHGQQRRWPWRALEPLPEQHCMLPPTDGVCVGITAQALDPWRALESLPEQHCVLPPSDGMGLVLGSPKRRWIPQAA